MSTLLKKFLENNKLTHFNIFNIFLSIMGVIFVRTFLENFSSPHISGYFFPPFALFFHYTFFYFSVIFSLILLLHLITKNSLQDLIHLAVKLLPIVWLAPIFDLIITFGKGWRMAYIFAGNPPEFIRDFFTFFGPIKDAGITPGLRIEIFLILLFIYLFILHETSSKFKAIIGTILSYGTFFIYLSFPSFIMMLYGDTSSNSLLFLNNIYTNSIIESQQQLISPASIQNYILAMEQASNLFMSRVFWIIIFFQLIIILFIYNKNIFLAWIKNSRWERVIYYYCIAIFGMAISFYTLNKPFLFNANDVLGIIVFFLLIAINFWLAVIVNDFVDINIDSISNKKRPLVAKTLSKNSLIAIGFVLIVINIGGIFLLSYIPLISLLFFQFVYFIYSSYPLHLKKTFITSSALLGLNAVLIALGGFFMLSPDQHISLFPVKFLWLIFLGFFIISNIKDIKDYEGDRLEKIYTIPVLIGLNQGKQLIGISCALFIIIFPIIFEKYFLFSLSILPALAVIYLTNKKRYEEYKIFLLFFFYSILLLIFFPR